MNILHLSNTPLSNSPSNLAQIQREAGHNSTVILHRDRNINKVFVGGRCWPEMERDIIEDTFKKADLIHYHNFAFEQFIFRPEYNGPFGIALEDIARQKPCLIQYHSPRHSTENFETTISDRFFFGRRAVVAQYQMRIYPEAEYVVPNVIPVLDPRFSPIPAKWSVAGTSFTVSFAPSNTHLKGWDDKGYEKTFPALHKWNSSGRVNADIITNTPFEDCLTRKRWAHVGIEELVTGSYHMSFLEYLSMGTVTLGNIDELSKKAMAMVVGEEGVLELPYIQTTHNNLEPIIDGLLKDIDRVKDYSVRSRDWMLKYWHPKRLNRIFENIYANA